MERIRSATKFSLVNENIQMMMVVMMMMMMMTMINTGYYHILLLMPLHKTNTILA